ncbi:MAG: 30S ribosomal protein S15 [Bacilli bacterium]
MSCITKEEKAKLVSEFGQNDKDSGSVEVQVAILTAEINKLNQHLKVHIHDYHTGRGLLMKIGHRRNLLNYLKKTNVNSYRNVIAKLGLRK